MSSISNINSDILNSQLSAANVSNQIQVKIAKKSLDANRQQGEMALKLLDSALDVAQQGSVQPELTMGAVVSGLGQCCDVRA